MLSACHFRIEQQCATLRHLVPHLARHARHVEREEKEPLPMAARLLGDDELERIGRAMRKRHGIAVIAFTPP